jgi:hypothetical protein
MQANKVAMTMLLCAISASSAELLPNGNFSAGLDGWTFTNAGVGLGGEAQVLNSLGSLAPFSAPQFLLLDTGPSATFGSATPTFANLSTMFTLAAADTVTVSFRPTLLTARFTGDFATELDRFMATLTPSSGPSINLLHEDLSNANFQILDNAPVTSPSGSSFFEYLPSQLVSQQWALAAGAYTLSFRVETDQNSLFDSGILVDAVSVQTSNGTIPQVPEPGSVFLMASGVTALAAMRRKFRSRV